MNSVTASDNLLPLRELLLHLGSLYHLFDFIPQFHFVIDTNVILEDLHFLVKSRRNPSARTSLQEAIDSGAVTAFAPTKLCEEVNRNIPILAAERKVSEERLYQEWQQYQSSIRFYEINSATGLDIDEVVDPDDLPFVYLYHQIKADAVLTRDRHISMMGANSVVLEAIIHIRDYARDKTPEVTLRFGAVAISGLMVGGTVAVAKLSTAAVKSFSKLPVWIQFALLISAAVASIHPRSRKVLSLFLRSIATKLKEPSGLLLSVFDTLTRELSAAQHKARFRQRILEEAIPRATRRTLKMVAESVCAQADGPVTIDELARGVVRAGYQPRSSEFKRYLQKVLRQSDQFIRTEDGRWSVQRSDGLSAVQTL